MIFLPKSSKTSNYHNIRRSASSILFGVVIFVSMIIFSSCYFILNNQVKLLKDKTLEHHLSLLYQTKVYSDANLSFKTKSVIVERLMTYNQFSKISRFFEEDVHVSELYDVFNELKTIVANNSLFESIYMYNENNDVLINSKYGVFLDTSKLSEYYINLIDIPILRLKDDMITPSYWIGDEGKLHYVQVMRNMPSIESKLGLVIIDFNMDAVNNEIKNIFNIPNSTLLILDKNNQPIVCGKYENYEWLNQNYSFKELFSKSQGTFSSNYKDLYYTFTYIVSPESGWKYVSIVPEKELHQQIENIKLLVWAIGLFLFGVSVGLIFQILRGLYHPLINMSKVLEKNKLNISSNLVNEFINGQIKSFKEITQRLGFLNQTWSGKKLFVLILQLDSEVLSKFSFEEHEHVLNKSVDLITEFLLSKFNIICRRSENDLIYCVINCCDVEIQDKDLIGLMNIIRSECLVNANVMVSDSFEDINQITAQFNKIKRLVSYSFIYGFNNINKAKDFEDFQKNWEFILQDTINDLNKLIAQNQIKEIISMIKALPFRIRTYKCSYDFTFNMITQIVYQLVKAFEANQLSNEIFSMPTIMKKLEKSGQIDIFILELVSLVEIYAQHLQYSQAAIHAQLMEKIICYIENNISEDISLSVVAEAFSISVGNLSRTFKHYTNINFHDYVIDKKLDYAAKLLIEKDYRVNEVAEQLGYHNVSYFTKIFKNKFSVTPYQYKKFKKNEIS